MADRWDETVDVICLGSSPGVLAYAICCAARDQDVLNVRPPREPDPQTAAWYAEMSVDLAPRLNPGRGNTPDGRPEFSFARVAPVAEPSGQRVALEPFVGERLRQWSAHCVASPLGVMFSQVPEALVPMRTDDGESITAAIIGTCSGDDLLSWLESRARDAGLRWAQSAMTRAVLENGRMAGVELDDGSLIAAKDGLVLPVSADSAPVPDLSSPDGYVVALVGRPAGRFAEVDLLRT